MTMGCPNDNGTSPANCPYFRLNYPSSLLFVSSLTHVTSRDVRHYDVTHYRLIPRPLCPSSVGMLTIPFHLFGLNNYACATLLSCHGNTQHVRRGILVCILHKTPSLQTTADEVFARGESFVGERATGVAPSSV